MPRVGMSVHQRLGLREVVRVPAFDRIGRERERRPGETRSAAPRRQLLLNLTDGVEHVPSASRGSKTRSRRCRPGRRWALDLRALRP